MEPVILIITWLGIMGAVAVSDLKKEEPETLYKVEQCDCKGKCKTVLEIKEGM